MCWNWFFVFVLAFIICCDVSAKMQNKELFYIYETDQWPEIANASLIRRDGNERLENMLNNGAGPIVNITNGAYHTDQYQLFSMIFYRALKDPRRTLDPSKASTFIIPYDFATDAAYYKNCAKSAGVCYDFRKCPLAPTVETLLKDSKWFQRKQGLDHLLIVGMNYAMDHYILKPKCKSLLLTCSNCTKFAIDDYSFMYATNSGVLTRGDYWHAAPFPGDFHWTKHVQRPFPWENTDRPILVSYIGSVKSFYGPARRLRESIAHYCRLHAEDCYHQTYGLNGTRHSFHVDGYSPLQISQRSIFCFQPIGDLMTRKGLFDTLQQGCIPVVFDALTAQVMYTWHWEEAFWKEVIVDMPFHGVAHRYTDPVEVLKSLQKLNQTLIAHKQELIRQRIFQLQYSLDSDRDVYAFNSSLPYMTLKQTMSNSTETGILYETLTTPPKNDHRPSTWPVSSQGTPLQDAYDICIDLTLGWHSGRIVRVRNATVPECWDGWLDKIENKCKPGKEPVAGVKL